MDAQTDVVTVKQAAGYNVPRRLGNERGVSPTIFGGQGFCYGKRRGLSPLVSPLCTERGGTPRRSGACLALTWPLVETAGNRPCIVSQSRIMRLRRCRP